VFASPAPQSTHTPFLFGRYMGWLVPRLSPSELTPSTRNLLDTAFALGINEVERERTRDPRNELIYLQQSRLALLASQFYGLPIYYDYAVKSLTEAVRLSPRRVQPKLVLGYTLMIGKRFDEARVQLYGARDIYPTSGQIYYYIGELHRLQGDVAHAGAALDTSLTLGYKGPAEVYLAVIGGLQRDASYSAAASLGEKYLHAAQPGYNAEGSDLKTIPETQTVVVIMARLPWLWAKAGNTSRALGAIRNFKAAYPQGLAAANRFERELKSGKRSEWEHDISLLDLPKS
jgi:tetratricopeptide (TPR) repeat protein